MTVFNLCVKIMKSKMFIIMVYFTIFIGIAISFSIFAKGNSEIGFTAEKPRFTVVNRDAKSPLINGLVDFISENGVEVKIDDNMEKLQDAVFYNATDYIIIIPKGFSKDFKNDVNKLETVKFPNSAMGYQMEMLVNCYLKAVKMYGDSKTTFSEVEIAKLAKKDISTSADTRLISFGGSEASSKSFIIFNRYAPYVLTLVIVLCITSIMISMEKRSTRMRNLSSPKSNLSMSLSMLSFTFVFGLGTWLIMSLAGILINIGQIDSMSPATIGLTMLNSFSFMLFCVAISLLLGIFVKNSNGQNAAANILGLGLSFLGGVFVPLELLSESMMNFSKLTPTYWHTVNLNLIESMGAWNFENLKPILTGMAIQVGFAVMFFAIFLAVRRYKHSQESY